MQPTFCYDAKLPLLYVVTCITSTLNAPLSFLILIFIETFQIFFSHSATSLSLLEKTMSAGFYVSWFCDPLLLGFAELFFFCQCRHQGVFLIQLIIILTRKDFPRWKWVIIPPFSSGNGRFPEIKITTALERSSPH